MPGGDCQCSDGSDFSFWVREANPEKVILYFQDGGACYSAETCDPNSPTGGGYNTRVDEGPDPAGVFAFSDERNPFADYSVVYVPYCTADTHLGNATTEYAPDLTIQHKGAVNGNAALDHLAATFPDATDVVVMGVSAGSVAAPFYGGLVSDRLPAADVTVLANGSGSYPDVGPEVDSSIATAWGVANAFPDWPEYADVTPETWSPPRLYIWSGRHDPSIVFARIDFAYDARQVLRFSLLGLPAGDLLSRIDANESLVEDAGVDLLTYTAPGDGHNMLTGRTFYTETVGGETLVDWVTKVVERDPVDDVRCAECTTE